MDARHEILAVWTPPGLQDRLLMIDVFRAVVSRWRVIQPEQFLSTSKSAKGDSTLTWISGAGDDDTRVHSAFGVINARLP